MKIQDNQLSGLTGAGVGGAERARGAEALHQPGTGRSDQRTADGDRVQISSLSDALRAATEDTPERLAQVEQLHEAVHSGTYETDSRLVSQRLIEEALGGL